MKLRRYAVLFTFNVNRMVAASLSARVVKGLAIKESTKLSELKTFVNILMWISDYCAGPCTDTSLQRLWF